MAINLDSLGLAASVTPEGISAPDYQTILDKLTAYFKQIYGEDVYLDPDSKDGQMLALYALGIHDANNAAIAVYNSFSPATSTGRALSNNVKINGITRQVDTKSTVDVEITGDVGTPIRNGIVRDDNGIQWSLPQEIFIPQSGVLTVTATCLTSGPVVAPAGTIRHIATPTKGWRSVTNPAQATPGAKGESDAALRARQARSTALASQTTLDGIDGALLNVPGVTRVRTYENDTDITDDNGLPPHSICCVVEGGDATSVATVISKKKDMGTSTHGETEIELTGKYGEPKKIKFDRTESVDIFINIELSAYPGYVTTIADEMKEAIVSYINSLGIGENVLLSRIYSPANLGVTSGGNSKYYDINLLEIGLSADAMSGKNISVKYNQAAHCSIDNIKVIAS